MSTRVTFLLQEKGSLGKTFLAAHLYEYLKARGVPPALFDADKSAVA